MRRALRIGALVCALSLLHAAAASADNRRISISNYQWSEKELKIDRGEHVSWYWIGPDTMHSITGVAPDAAGIDSDPQTNQPRHAIGDSFQLDFDQPGTFEFQCKLHSTVRGTVEVSNKPGNPTAEPDPVPKSKVDLKSPNLRDARLDSTIFGRGGTKLRYSINERARITIEYFRFARTGRKRFAGYAQHGAGYIGFNQLRFGNRRKNFKARPGRYLAKVVAIDPAANRTRPAKLSFRIRGGKRSARH